MTRRFKTRRTHHTQRGFTLLESMLAASLLFVITVAVLSAITAGQQHAYEAHVRIAGTLAAEELMGRLSAEEYSVLAKWDNHSESVGNMVDAEGDPLPSMFVMLGRRVDITTTLVTLPNGVKVRGRNVTVECFDRDNRVVATVQQFIPEPMS